MCVKREDEQQNKGRVGGERTTEDEPTSIQWSFYSRESERAEKRERD